MSGDVLFFTWSVVVVRLFVSLERDGITNTKLLSHVQGNFHLCGLVGFDFICGCGSHFAKVFQVCTSVVFCSDKELKIQSHKARNLFLCQSGV